ncbi:MAG: tetratricopeptide repeat protein [Kangiellaceae bacterium]|nr:tetratricopeptide repeat protein [Kangiellaceae bacterium]
MSYQTEEQQVEQLKDWWKDNGTPLMVGAALGLSGFFGWKFYTEKQIAYQEAASTLYISVTEELEKDDNSLLIEHANAIKNNFSDTSYAVLSVFHLAKIAVDKADLDTASQELNWILDNHSSNELAAIARIRLARIFIAQQKVEQAIELLDFDSDSGYFEVANLIKGDALSVLGNKAEALEAYKAANNAGKTTVGHPTLKLLIDDLTASASQIHAGSEIESLDDSENSELNSDSETIENTNKITNEDNEEEAAK